MNNENRFWLLYISFIMYFNKKCLLKIYWFSGTKYSKVKLVKLFLYLNIVYIDRVTKQCTMIISLITQLCHSGTRYFKVVAAYRRSSAISQVLRLSVVLKYLSHYRKTWHPVSSLLSKQYTAEKQIAGYLCKYAIKKMFYAIKVERTGTHARTKKSLHKQIFMYGYRVLWAGFVTIAEVNKRTNEIARSIVNNVLNKGNSEVNCE